MVCSDKEKYLTSLDYRIVGSMQSKQVQELGEEDMIRKSEKIKQLKPDYRKPTCQINETGLFYIGNN